MQDKIPEKIQFFKMSGAGNDFIIIDNRNNKYSETAAYLAKKICRRRYSVGADGLIFLENSKKASFKAKFYNSDGSEFNLCGNGGRCAARFAFINVIAARHMTIETNSGVLNAEIIQNNVKLEIPLPVQIEINKIITTDEMRKIKGHYIKIGDPHLIIFAKNLNEFPIESVAKKIRYSLSFGKEGTNVNFIMQIRENRFAIRTYERGLEQETLACGSGCVSAAIVLHNLSYPYAGYVFETHSGFLLGVHLEFVSDKISKIFLEGDARIIYKGELMPEAWKYSKKNSED